MLLVATIVKPSRIEGLGLFAAADIPAGTVWWKFDRAIDRKFSEFSFVVLPKLAQEHIQRSGFKQNGIWVMCGDDARFVNHAFDAPTRPDPNMTASVTTRLIKAGEELTEDYSLFDENVRDFMMRE